jgi:5-methylcytosine-specific restriction enzyme subunit McrC
LRVSSFLDARKTVYQLYAFLRIQERTDDPGSLTTTGKLLHPQAGGSIDEEVTIQGHSMRFKTIDPSIDPEGFEDSVRRLIYR